MQRSHDSGHHAPIEGTNHLWVAGGSFSERTVGGEEHLSGGVGTHCESDSAHKFDQRRQNLFIPGVIGGANRGGKLLTIFAPNLFGDACNAVRLDPIENSHQEFDQQVISPSRMERNSFGGRFVAFGGSPRSRSGSAAAPLMGHLEITIISQSIEMMASHIGVD